MHSLKQISCFRSDLSNLPHSYCGSESRVTSTVPERLLRRHKEPKLHAALSAHAVDAALAFGDISRYKPTEVPQLVEELLYND